MTPYDPCGFWDAIHRERDDLTGVGHGGYGRRYNQHLYAAKERALHRALDRNNLQVSGGRILDVGCGIGYFGAIAKRLGASSYTGIDIAPAARDRVMRVLPEAAVIIADISAKPTNELRSIGTFDNVWMFDVAYHITQSERHIQAIDNVWSLVATGGTLLLVDGFGKRDLVPAGQAINHCVFHKWSVYDRALFSRSDARLIDLVPMYYLYNRPIIGDYFPWTTKRLNWHLRYRFFESRVVLTLMDVAEKVLVSRARRNASLKIAVVSKG